MKLDLKDYDNELLRFLDFQVRLNNYIIAIFKNADDLIEYIETFPKFKNKKYQWSICSNSTIILNFITESEE